ncbi:MAG TPA: biotin/lipoyl-containing protein, partial [Spirochaetia bacterium]|nr:biotin/lipoyl-containing protein [Spirochaetia bacterium]
MSVEVVMPRQGNTVESCIILSWKKRKGDRVKAGETLCEVETDKATFEVEAPADGTLLEVLFEEGADVAVLTPIAIIGDPSAGAGSAPPSAASAPATRSAASGASGAQVSPAAPHRPAAQSGGETARKRISPRARRLAESEGLEYGGLSGSGPGGRILERDVRDALASGARSAAAASPPSSSATPSESAGGEEIALTGVRRLTARRMHESLSQTAQLTLFASADARA